MKALGTTLTVNSAAIGGLTSISGVEISADTIDKTTLDSEDGYREFEGGLIDGGEVTAEGYLSDQATSEVTLTGLVGGEAKACVIQFPKGSNTTSGPKWEFDGIVTSFSTSADLEGKVGFSIGIKVSGKPELTAGA